MKLKSRLKTAGRAPMTNTIKYYLLYSETCEINVVPAMYSQAQMPNMLQSQPFISF